MVSVVIPVLDGERHIQACMTSVLDQTYEHFEVVVADNASTDRTAEIARSFDDPRVRFLPNPTERLSLHDNWTRGLSGAKGEFVKIVCHDDLLIPECLSVQVGLLRRYPSAALACGRRRIIDDDNKVIVGARGLRHLAKPDGPRVASGGALARACTRAGTNLLGEPAGVLIRRSFLPEPLFDPRWNYTIDIEFYMRCVRQSDAVVDNRVLCCFRVSHKQLSASLAGSQVNELRALFTEMARRYPDDVSSADIWLGTARAHLLARARRMLYWQMRMQPSRSTRRDRREMPDGRQ